MAKIDKVRESGKEFVLSMIEKHGMDKTALFFGYVRPDGTGNGGVISNIIKDEGWRSESTERVSVSTKSKASTPRAKKVDGFLPGRVSDWVVRKLGFEPDDGDKLPEEFGPAEFMALPDVAGETANYLRLLSRLCPDNEIAPLKAWLGCGLTSVERRIPKLIKVAAEDATKFFEFRNSAAVFGFRVITDDLGNIQVLGN